MFKISSNLVFLPVVELSTFKGLLPPLGGRGPSGSPIGVSALPLSYEMKNPVFLINLFFPRKKGWRAAGRYPTAFVTSNFTIWQQTVSTCLNSGGVPSLLSAIQALGIIATTQQLLLSITPRLFTVKCTKRKSVTGWLFSGTTDKKKIAALVSGNENRQGGEAGRVEVEGALNVGMC